MHQEVIEATEYLSERILTSPDCAITLGSGLGSFINEVDVTERIPYQSVPHVQSATVSGHKGEFVVGSISETPIIALNGRLHYYELGQMDPVVFPVRVIENLGCSKIILTNAAGGVNPEYNPGDIMIIEDHINNMGDNPLIGFHTEDFGPRFPDMTNTYNDTLRQIVRNQRDETTLTIQEGVYLANSGPSYETPAEIQMIQNYSDAVGMSTVPEAIVANQMGMDILGLSTITNHAAGVTGEPLSHSEVKEVAESIESDLNRLLRNIISEI